MLGDQFQLRAALQQPAGHFRDAHQQDIRITDLFRRDLHAAAQAEFGHFMSGGRQQRDAGRIDLFRNNDLCHFLCLLQFQPVRRAQGNQFRVHFIWNVDPGFRPFRGKAQFPLAGHQDLAEAVRFL